MYHPLRWFALLGVSLLAFTVFLDVTIVNTALPFIQKAFDASVLELQWVSNMFAMLLSMTMIAVGKFADLFGRRKIFFSGVILFAVAAIGAGASPSMGWLIFFRGLQGLGGSMLFISSAALINEIFPSDEHAKAVSVYTGITGAGLTVGPAVGGLLVGFLDWRWVFWVNVPMIALGLGLCAFSMNRPPVAERSKVEIDWWGLILLVVGLGGFTYGIVTGAELGWFTPGAFIPLVGGLLALVGLVVLEERVSQPLLEIRLFSHKLIFLSALSCSVGGFVSYVFMFFDPLYLKVIRSLSPFEIGFLVSLIPVAQVLVSIGFSPLLKKFGVANLLLISIGSTLLSAICHIFIGETFPLAWLAIPFFLLGITWGLSNTCLMTAVNQTISGEKVGKAIGTVATLWNVIGGIFLAVSSAIFHLVQEKHSFMDAFHVVGVVNAACIVVAFGTAVWARVRLSR